MVNAQEYLDNNYPKDGACKSEKDWKGNPNPNYGKKREDITELDIARKDLESSLDLTGFVNLTKLECSGRY